jgi:osmoprotectant transport system substrate-binding protein
VSVTIRTWTRGLHALLAVALALTLAVAFAACGDDDKGGGGGAGGGASTTGAAAAQPGKGKPPVTLGDKNFTEQYILGELYAQALGAKGYTVRVKSNIGSSEIIDKALTSGKIDFYPEYTGVILTELAHQTRRPSDADEAYQAAKGFQEKRGYTLLEKTPFFDTDAVAVKPDYAEKNGLKSVADLKKLGRKFRLGGPPEFRTRFSGLVGLKEEYGVSPAFRPLSIGLQYKALDSGKIDGANVFTTDGALGKGGYKVLEDPKNIFGFQNVAPVVSQKILDAQGPQFAETINAVSAKLTTEAMQRMNAAVDLDKQKPAAVAKQFLEANQLL